MRPTHVDRRAVVAYVALCVSLNYRADRPWSGLVGGVYAVVLLALVMTLLRLLAQLAAVRNRDGRS